MGPLFDGTMRRPVARPEARGAPPWLLPWWPKPRNGTLSGEVIRNPGVPKVPALTNSQLGAYVPYRVVRLPAPRGLRSRTAILAAPRSMSGGIYPT
jgi:hypothetical protein